MKTISLYLLLGVVLVTGGFVGVKAYMDNRYGEADLANGKTQFTNNCMVCHGNKGHGDGLVAQSLEVKPDNIHAELTNSFGMKFELIDSVLQGDNGQNGVMPAFKDTLTEKDVNDIFEYIKSIN